jgi:hypothetical protein
MSPEALSLLMALVLAHLVGDFLLQPRRWVEERYRLHQRSPRLLLHALLHGLLAGGVLLVATGASSRGAAAAVLGTLAVGSLAPLQALAVWLASPTVLGVATAYLLVTRPLSIAIALIMQRWSVELEDTGTLARAGARIGVLERLLVLTLVLLDQLTAVGFLLAAKSVLRFGDLRETRDRKLTEYVLLGTLLSVSTTLVLGMLVRLLPLGG